MLKFGMLWWSHNPNPHTILRPKNFTKTPQTMLLIGNFWYTHTLLSPTCHNMAWPGLALLRLGITPGKVVRIRAPGTDGNREDKKSP